MLGRERPVRNAFWKEGEEEEEEETGREAVVAPSRPCPEVGACLPSGGEEERERFPTQTSEIQRRRISLLAPRRALRSLLPRPPPRQVFGLCVLTPQPFGVRDRGFGARAGRPTPPGARGAHLESAAPGNACLRPAEGEQRQTSYSLGSKILLSQREVVFTRARRASLCTFQAREVCKMLERSLWEEERKKE